MEFEWVSTHGTQMDIQSGGEVDLHANKICHMDAALSRMPDDHPGCCEPKDA
jgi:hypothetical protein